MKKRLYLALGLMLASCNDKSGDSRPENLLASSDFEQVEGWNGDAPLPPSLTREKAHSGVYSMRVGPDVEYASGFTGTLGKMSPTRLTQVQIKARVYITGTGTAASLVTQVMDPATPNAKPLLWESLPLEKTVTKRNQWVEIEKTVTLPPNSAPTHKLYVYLWRGASPSVVYIDDMEVLRVK